MNFQTNHIIVVVVTLIAMWILWRWDRNSEEGFTAVQYYPYVKPENWKNFDAKEWKPYWYYESKYKTPEFVSKWNPLWDSDDAYHPIVPKIVRYNSPHIDVNQENGVEHMSLSNPSIDMEKVGIFILLLAIVWYFSS